MEDSEFPFFNCPAIVISHQSIVEEFRFASGRMGEVAGATYDLEVGSKLIFLRDDELSAVAVQALKSLENDVAHPLDMGWSVLAVLFNSGIGCSAGHGVFSVRCPYCRMSTFAFPWIELRAMSQRYERNSSIERR